MPTSPQCFLNTLMHCCRHSETAISFNVGGKCSFCDQNVTFETGICFATMVTKSRRRRKQDHAWKHEHGNFRWSVQYYEKPRGWNCYQHLDDTYRTCCSYLKIYVSTQRMYIYQRKLRLFVFHFQVSVIVALRHNKLRGVLHFKASVNI